MLNEDKVIMMTKMASYEENEGKKNVRVLNYFRSDYIMLQLLKSIVCATIAFLVVFGVYVLYDFENFMMNLYKLDLLEYGRSVLLKYLIVVGIYSFITYVLYAYRYAKARKGLRIYLMNLKKLNNIYN